MYHLMSHQAPVDISLFPLPPLRRGFAIATWQGYKEAVFNLVGSEYNSNSSASIEKPKYSPIALIVHC